MKIRAISFALVAIVLVWAATRAAQMRLHAQDNLAANSRPAGQNATGTAQPAMVSVIVVLKEKEDLSTIKEPERRKRLQQVVTRLRQKSNVTQKRLQKFLQTRASQGLVAQVQPFWVFNGLAVEAMPSVIQEMTAFTEVAQIIPNTTIQAPAITASSAVVESNLALVNAPALWSLGWQGQGIVVANLDTGVDNTHPDLAAKWRGGTNSWFDPYNQHSTPVDNAGSSSGHGTWTMGVMVGGSASGSSIGMAPGAQWIAAKIFNDQGTATVAAIHAAYQWLLDPDNTPTTDDAPQVVNNSWTFQTIGCNLEFAADLQALRAAGILPIFAAGNGGPAASTDYSPSNNPGAFAVGAIDNKSAIYAYSSRGPTTCGGTTLPFPQLVAPGVNILTSGIFGTYTYASGTSLAAPHVAGTLALLLSAYPNLTTSQQEAALYNSAVDLGTAGPDNTFGYGRLDVLRAYQWLSANGSNQAPTVNAGADQSITLPATAQLNGVATDDGQPTSAILTTTWSVVSGPSTVTIATPQALQTTATFNTAGTYTLRLTASDSQLTTSDDLVITVNTPNQAPTVNAGADQSITLPAAAQLSGTATDDGQPTPATLTTQWSSVSGPGTVTFATPQTLQTSATFSAAGQYTLRLTVSDGQLSSSDDIVITAAPQPNLAPTVNAGIDQSITLPTTAQLSGTATDDGKPMPPTLTPQWSTVSGPGTVTFATAQALQTTAAFSTAGTYTLRLTVSDGQLSTSDDIVITVAPQPNLAPTVNAGADQSITLPATAQLSGTATDDGQPAPATLTPQWSTVSGPGTVTFATPQALQTTAAFSTAGTYTLRLTVSDGQLSTNDDLIVTVNAQILYLSASANGTVGGVAYQDEDIIAYNPATNRWSLVLDGSDVGLGNSDIDAFDILPDGSFLLSLDSGITINGPGAVKDTDVLRFTPTALGNTTTGTFTFYLRGADVGLTTTDEDIDALDLLPDGRLLFSTLGNVSMTGVTGADEDLVVLTLTTKAAALYFDGSAVGLSATSEDLWGVWSDGAGQLYLSTQGSFAVTGVSGTGADIFVCKVLATGLNTTNCTFSSYWKGATVGFTGIIDDFMLGSSLPLFTPAAQIGAASLDDGSSNLDDDPMNGDSNTAEVPAPDTETPVQTIFLPLIKGR